MPAAGIQIQVGISQIQGLNQTQQQLQQLGTQANATGTQLSNNLTRGSNQAANALTNVGRVAQDVPFGFIGIQNNLNPLLESFQRLRQEMGSNTAALRALGQSLTGAAGIGIALSLVSSGILLYQQYAQKAAKETKALADSIDGLADSASGEIAKLTILYDASQNLNIPLSERKKIVDEIQKQYPTTFGNLKDEAILAGKATDAYDSLTQSLINNAIVQGGQDIIAAKVKDLARQLISVKEAEIKYAQQVEATNKKLNDRKKVSEDQGFRSGSADPGFRQPNTQPVAIAAVQTDFVYDKTTNKLISLSNYKKEEIEAIQRTRDAVQSVLGNFSAQDIIGNFSDKPDRTKEVKLKPRIVPDYASFVDFKEQLQNQYTNLIDGLPDVLNNDNLTVPVEVPLNLIFDNPGNYVTPYFEALAQQFNDGAQKIFDSGVVQTFAGIGEAIGGALANGGDVISEITKSLLSNLGSVMIQLGELCLGVAVGIESIKLALQSLLPGPALAAGIALIALGSFVKGSAANIAGGGSAQKQGTPVVPGFAGGVTDFGGGLAYVHKGEVLANLPKGTDVLRASEVQAMSSPRGFGASPSLSPSFEIINSIRGQDIVTLVRQVEGNNRRLGV